VSGAKLTRLVLGLFWVLSLPVFLVAGCAEVGEPGTLRLTVLISEGLPPTPTARIKGGMLCQANPQGELESDNCDVSGADGEASITLPANERVIWTLVKEGYGSTLTPDVTDADFNPETTWQLWTNEWYAENFARLMTPYPMAGTGAIYVFVQGRVPGVTFRLVDATGIRYYFDDEGNLSPDLEATTSLGAGGFVEVQPGDFQVEIGWTSTCVPTWAWPGDPNNRITVPVRAGYMTTTVIRCPLPL
jgi:hypothetical protein